MLATPANGLPVGIGASSLTPATPVSHANIATGKVPGGNYGITATYGGDSKYFSSTSDPVSVIVSPEPSQTYLGLIGGGSFTTAPLSVAYGTHQQIGIIVAGNSGAGYPSGQLALQADGASIATVSFDPGTGALNPSSLILNFGEHSTVVSPTVNSISQSSTVSYLPPSTSLGAGTHVLQATYPGDASFSSSVSNNYTYTVTKAEIAIQDFFPLGSVVTNAPVHLMGQIGFVDFYSYAPFTGTVTITDTTTGTPVVIGSGPLLQDYGGSYDILVTFTSGGTHDLVLNFSGDANTKPASTKYHVPVDATASPYVSVATDVPSAAIGSPITVTAQVVSPVQAHSIVGQSVTFSDGATVLGTAGLAGPGVNQGGGALGYSASLVVNNFSGGVHSLTAKYSGDTVLTAADSTSSPVFVSVADYTLQAAPTSLTITSGQSGTATISIIPLGSSTQTVQLSCGTLPADVACSFAPSSVTLDGINAGAAKVTVTTRQVAANAAPQNNIGGAVSTLAFAGILLPFVRRKRLKAVLGVAALLVVALVGVGCGSSR